MLDFDVPDYAMMTADSRTLALNNMQRTAKAMAKDYPDIPVVEIHPTNIAPSYLRRAYIQLHGRTLQTLSESWAERARVALTFCFCVVEFLLACVNIPTDLCAKITGGRMMSWFDAELRTVGDIMTARTGGGKQSNPFVKIGMYLAMSVGVAVAGKVLSIIMPARMADGFLNFMLDTFFGTPAKARTAAASWPSRPSTDAPSFAPRPTTSFMGIPIVPFMAATTGAAANAFQGSFANPFTGGAAPARGSSGVGPQPGRPTSFPDDSGFQF